MCWGAGRRARTRCARSSNALLTRPSASCSATPRRSRSPDTGRVPAPHLVRVQRLVIGSSSSGVQAERRGMSTVPVRLTVNGQPHEVEVEARLLAVQADGAEVKTIEGMADGDKLHPLQEAFWNDHGLQCGYCTPGMIMAAADLLQRNPDPTEEEVRHGLEGNLCRCTGYHNIVKAVLDAAKAGKSGASAPQEVSA